MLCFRGSQYIVRVVDFFPDNARQHAHFLLEFCPGNSLYVERAVISPFPEPVVAKVALQLGQGLFTIHKKGTKSADVAICLVAPVLADVMLIPFDLQAMFTKTSRVAMCSRRQETSSKLTSKLATSGFVSTCQTCLQMQQKSIHWAPGSIWHLKLGKASLPPVATCIV